MNGQRPILTVGLDADAFTRHYYLKEELALFCRANALQATGSKEQLTERIALFLRTGERVRIHTKQHRGVFVAALSLECLIDKNMVCSEVHRSFFRLQIGNVFSFNVSFQRWLKANAGKTYREAIEAWHVLREEKKGIKGMHPIAKQFEYNTYIRGFFKDNPGKDLKDAIRCWKYKKGLPGSNGYEKGDLEVLQP